MTSLFNSGQVLMLLSPISGVAWRSTLLSLSYGFSLVLSVHLFPPEPCGTRDFCWAVLSILLFFICLTLAQYILLYSKQIPRTHSYDLPNSN
jgi:hypothetical protein